MLTPSVSRRGGSGGRPPRVSVIVPVHNGEPYLAEALRSVRSQSVRPFEIVVVDDGSTDDTPRVVREAGGCVYRRQKRVGPAAARNRGLAAARGDVVGFLDSDDLWPPEKLATQLSFLEANPDVEAVLGKVQWLRRAAPGGPFEPAGAPMSGFQLGCGLFRRALFARVGPFDAALPHSEDVDWLLRARERRASIVAVEEVGLLYRHHESSLTFGKPAPQLDLLRVLKRSLDRRKRGPGPASVLSPVARRTKRSPA